MFGIGDNVEAGRSHELHTEPLILRAAPQPTSTNSQGARPADLPVEQASNSSLSSLKTRQGARPETLPTLLATVGGDRMHCCGAYESGPPALIALALFLKTGSKRTCEDFKYLQAISKAPMTRARQLTARRPCARSASATVPPRSRFTIAPAPRSLRQSQWTRPSKSSTPAR